MWLEATLVAVSALQLALLLLLIWQSSRSRRNPTRRNPTNPTNPVDTGGGVTELLVINTLNRIDHRMDAVEERLKRLLEQGQRRDADLPQPAPSSAMPPMPMPMPQEIPSADNYQLAQQLAREGGDSETLMERCGLSRNEAELVLHLYADRR